MAEEMSTGDALPRTQTAAPPVFESTGQTVVTAAASSTSPTISKPAPTTHDDPMSISPTTSTAAASMASPVPLDSPLRTTPIHPSIPAVKMPNTASSNEANINPVTLQPFSEAELAKYGFEKLRAQIVTATAAAMVDKSETSAANGLTEKEKEELQRMKDETAAHLKHKLDERENKVREIEREMQEKEKIREVERKVFRKKLGAGKDV